jgi:hypothetical protein
VSIHEPKEPGKLIAIERQVYWVSDLPEAVSNAIEDSQMSPVYNHLNELLDEKP